MHILKILLDVFALADVDYTVTATLSLKMFNTVYVCHVIMLKLYPRYHGSCVCE